ncbi:MAG: LysM peptidoglycan-binding domain-containing protein, partial [Lachnospiraceae bacterium]|nr:LysM peptidoglycan-binding domain-containing protein [Lachnospiraceae bacterium]
YGQSLWDIASEYADSHYDSVADYIEEVTFINHIEDPDQISAGTVLVVPYYSAEFKQ